MKGHPLLWLRVLLSRRVFATCLSNITDVGGLRAFVCVREEQNAPSHRGYVLITFSPENSNRCMLHNIRTAHVEGSKSTNAGIRTERKVVDWRGSTSHCALLNTGESLFWEKKSSCIDSVQGHASNDLDALIMAEPRGFTSRALIRF